MILQYILSEGDKATVVHYVQRLVLIKHGKKGFIFTHQHYIFHFTILLVIVLAKAAPAFFVKCLFLSPFFFGYLTGLVI